MAGESDKAVLTKCRQCEKPLNTPLFCDYCHSLNPIPSMADHFQLLGLPRRFEIDAKAMHDSYVSLSRHAHPDYHVDDSPEVRSLSLAVSSAANEAFRTLADPVLRAGYLLELLGGPSSAADKSVPEGFLNTMVMMREELAEAKGEGNVAEIDRLDGVLRMQQDGMMKKVAALFADVEGAASCEATLQDLLHELRKQLNAVSYVKKMLSQM